MIKFFGTSQERRDKRGREHGEHLVGPQVSEGLAEEPNLYDKWRPRVEAFITESGAPAPCLAEAAAGRRR